MTSKRDHGDGSNGDGATKAIHFFRILLPNTLLDGNMRIPRKFVRKYGERLTNPMFLKLPNGAEWKINLEKRDEDVWFQNGWKKFVDDLSLAHGHMLVFRYEGTSHFNVLICDMSTTEIDYPFNKVDGKRVSNDEELQPSKTPRTNGNNKVESNLDLQHTTFHQKVRDCKGKLKNPSEEKWTIDLHTKRSFFSNCAAQNVAGNTSFTVIIKSRHLIRGDVGLPRSFQKGDIKPGRKNVTLQVGERSWRVTLIHYEKYSSSHFSGGWLAFARENNLEVGDACLFELLHSSDDMVMKVSISKHSSVKT